MVQILTYSGQEYYFEGEGITLSKIHDAKSLDEFDINIISLADKKMWSFSGLDYSSIDIADDLKSLSTMIKRSKKSKVIILLPQNERFYYNRYNNKYYDSIELKNMDLYFNRILSVLYMPIGDLKINYENTMTKVGNESLPAAFYFCANNNIILKSDKSEKPTVIYLNGVILSTIDLRSYERVINFLKEIKLFQDKQGAPKWMERIKMFDDDQQFKIIEDNNQTIKIANDNISNAMEKINKNNEYKSILYTTGDELVRVVFEILEKMLGCDLSQFVDKRNEDFLFEKNGFVFIGEIKGVNHNVKSENISQLDVHYQGYLEENEEKNEDCIKAILIMNHQKNKALETREPVHEKQISLAIRNGSLIVETITLLKLFEKYLVGNLTQEECLELLKINTGLLKV